MWYEISMTSGVLILLAWVIELELSIDKTAIAKGEIRRLQLEQYQRMQKIERNNLERWSKYQQRTSQHSQSPIDTE